MNILLADDDPISRKIISGFLSRFGYQVKVVNDGFEAWGHLQTQSAPQLAIFDWMMPRMSGLEVVTRLRGLKKKERTYVILLSSRNSKLDVIKGLEAGADDYLVKPCDLAELQARLRVAERAIQHDQQLRKTINDLESLVRRHNLLGAIAGQQVVAAAAAKPEPEPAPTPKPAPPTPPAEPTKAPSPTPAGPTETPPPPAELPPLRNALAHAFRQIGLGGGTVGTDDGTLVPEFAVLLPVYNPSTQTWIDTRLEFDRRSAHGVCRTLLHRGANSPQELQDVLVEMIHLLSGTPAMNELKHAGTLLTLTAAPIDNPASPGNASRPGGTRYSIRFDGGLKARVTEFATDAPASAHPPAELSLGEVVLEKITSARDHAIVLALPGHVVTSSRLAALHEDGRTAPVKVVAVPASSRPHLPFNFA